MTTNALYIDRPRYRKIVRFFGGAILHFAFIDVLFGRIPGVRWLILRSRPRRMRRFARRFRDLAVEMGGVMIKLGQFLSARVDVLPVEVTQELQGLQDTVPSISLPIIRRTLQKEFGDLNEIFYEVEMEPLAAASLGQTMRAWLKDENGERGAAVVIKVLRPTIEAIVHTDLAALDTVAPWLMRYKKIARRANVPNIMEEFGKTLWEELDYEQEVRSIKRFQVIFADQDHIYIPEVYEEISTPRAIVLENVENPKINDLEAIQAADIDAKKVASDLIESYLFQLIKHGFFHADPHPGNIFIRPVGPELTDEERAAGKFRKHQIIFIDFGMIGRLPADLRQNMGQVLISLVQKDGRRAVNAYNQMGFFLPGADLERIIEAQNFMMEKLDGRNLMEMANPDPDEIREIGNEFRDILFDLPFQVPQNFVYLGRALGILSGIASGLHPTINPWYSIQGYGMELLNLEQQFDFSADSVQSLLANLTPYLRLPGQIQRVVTAAENGKLRITSNDPSAARRLDRLERKIGWMNVSI
ncbi:MAG: putative unusual protein kinase regulating ubiquinone biosynthesis (AarF/ABC1/UbiB family), partial [Cellvibrionaceae bacterium]